MRRFVSSLLLLGAVAATPAPPDPKRLLPKYTIDLDLPAEQRWHKVADDHKNYIGVIIDMLKVIFKGSNKDAMVAAVKKGLGRDYLAELQGYSARLEQPLDDIIMANIYYELSKIRGSSNLGPDPSFDVLFEDRSCTSIVTRNANGTMYLARNQDYPPLFTPLEIHAQFTRGGKLAYEGTVFAGTTGIVTGQVPGGWAVSIDARGKFSPTLPEAVAVAEAGGWTFPLITRAAMEQAVGSYDAAIKFFRDTPMISPGYLIVGGAATGQGAVVTTNSSARLNDVWEIGKGWGRDAAGKPWYLVETNYDHQQPDWATDGRRSSAKKQLDAIGAGDITLLGLWDVLSTAPVYNAATIHTELVDIAAGDFRTYRRHGLLPEMPLVAV